MTSLDQLLQGVGAGDQAAFGSLYTATSRRVYGLALRILRDHHAAQEVTLDVYFRVWRQASRFDGARGHAEAWLLTLAHHQAVDRLRSRQRQATREFPLELYLEVPDGKPSPEALSLDAERVRRLRGALQMIPEAQRQAIVAAYFGGMSHSEIAAVFGEPLGTIKTRIRSGMAALRHALSDGGGPARDRPHCPRPPSVASRRPRERRPLRNAADAAAATAYTPNAARPAACERPHSPRIDGLVAARRDRTVTDLATAVTSVPVASPYIWRVRRIRNDRRARRWESGPRAADGEDHMRRLIAAARVGLFVVLAAGTVTAQTFTATMAGSREPGGGDPAGRGLATITFNGGNVYYFLWVQNIATPGAAHIHAALAGAPGAVVVGFSPTWSTVASNTYVAMGSVAADSSTTGPILTDPAAFYVNVHNTQYPNGALRGQLLGDGAAGYALATDLIGSREPSGGATAAQGYTALVFDGATVYYYLWETGLSTPTAAHVHTGAPGVSGPVLVGLSPTFTGGQASGMVTADLATVAAIEADPALYYVNIHTGDFPNGAIRGQLAPTETDVSFPVVAHNPGLGTSYYRTDMRALSLTDEPATAYAEWYPHGVSNATGPASTTEFTIPAGGEAVYDDVVSSLLGAADRGAIRLLSAFPFKAIARNYNDQRAVGSGTFGQDEPGFGPDGALTSGGMLLNSNRPKTDAAGFRTNVGYFNPSPNPVEVTFNVRNPDGSLVAPPSQVTFPAWDDDQQLFYQIIPGIPTAEQTLDNFFITFTATQPIYIYSSPVDNVTDDGFYQAALTLPAALTQQTTAQLSPPTGTISAPAGNVSVTEGTAVAFQGSGTDPQGEALSATWEFGDGSSGTGYTTTHTYAATGTFTVTMTVTNTSGLSDPNPPTRSITVTASQSSAPTGMITSPAGNISTSTNTAVSFVGTGTDPKGESLTGMWNFGDGNTGSGFSVTHSFASAGSYTVTFTVTNTDGVSDPNPPTRKIMVTNYGY